MQFFPFSSHTTFPLQVPTSPCPLQVLLQELNIPKLQTHRNGVHFPPSCACDALGPRPRAVLRLVDALPQGATLEELQALGARLGGGHQPPGCPWAQPGTSASRSSPPGTESGGFLQFWAWLHGEGEVTVQSGLECHDPAMGHRPSCSPTATPQPPPNSCFATCLSAGRAMPCPFQRQLFIPPE